MHTRQDDNALSVIVTAVDCGLQTKTTNYRNYSLLRQEPSAHVYRDTEILSSASKMRKVFL